MNRIDRVSAILIQLQSRKVIKAQDIADRFGISLRTVYRDVRTLEEAGIPILGEAGVGYSIMDGYRLPPVMFTKEEATAFLTAEKMIEKLADSSTNDSYKSAMYKIRSVLRNTEKDFLENLDDHILVVKSRRQAHQQMKVNPIQTILKCIADKQVISIQYFSHYSQQKSERNIEPIGIFYLDSYWHLIAYCRLRKDYRDFRIDRINTIQPTSQNFDNTHPTLKDYLKQMMVEKNVKTIVVRIDKAAMPFIEDQKYYNGFVSQKELKEQVEVSFVTASFEGFARWFMTFGDCAEIISPKEIKEKIRNQIKAVEDRMVSSSKF